ncbi:unnamed protein product [Caenorhabditis angaria]|uniref:C-type lectin domain-containing protein n=1 Tax=Caenorhabditis angaria TaxID=860376 RepID=A0A9P1N458_9PELO|nr:unnamed protein product [Caenorhabditis angaria]
MRSFLILILIFLAAELIASEEECSSSEEIVHTTKKVTTTKKPTPKPTKKSTPKPTKKTTTKKPTTKKPTKTTKKRIPTTTKRVPKCQKGWKGFKRAKGLWCIKVQKSKVNRNVAQAQCKKLGATLTGIDSVAENRFLQAQGVVILKSLGLQVGTMWIGLVRKPACYSLATKNSPNCIGSNGFQWTDGVTTRKNTMTWRIIQPDNHQGRQKCAYLQIGRITKYGIRPGTIDDIECDHPWNPANLDVQKQQGFACGKWAK